MLLWREKKGEKSFIEKKEDNRKEMQERQKRNWKKASKNSLYGRRILNTGGSNSWKKQFFILTV
jgi:hypothetical protein